MQKFAFFSYVMMILVQDEKVRGEHDQFGQHDLPGLWSMKTTHLQKTGPEPDEKVSFYDRMMKIFML